MQPNPAGGPHAAEPFSTKPFAGAARGDQPAPAEDSADGPITVARYTIERRLGQGGFGAVYLAFDPLLNRQAAIKLPKHTADWSPEQTQEFLDEARLAAGLTHPHIVTIYDAGICPAHGVFIAMEYIEGQTLAQRLKGGKLSVGEATRICGQIADAIHHGHKHGLVHRDLKPANILLDQAGSAKVCDFGLALHEDAQRQHEGEITGTVPYMSPEQIRGESHLLDGRSDIWSLGVILYECLAGRRPFRGENRHEIAAEILTRDPKPLRQLDDTIPEGIDEICRRCLERDVARRWRSALDVREHIAAIAAGTPVPRPRAARWIGLALVALLATAITVGVLWNSGNHNPPADKPPVTAVVRLLPDDKPPGTDWQVLREGSAVYAESQSFELLQLGTLGPDDKIELDISQGRWNGGIGLFLGQRPEPRRPETMGTCQALIIEKGNGSELRLHRVRFDYPLESPSKTRIHYVDAAPIQAFNNEALRISVRLKNGTIHEVTVAGKMLNQLTDRGSGQTPRPVSDGPYGLVLTESSGTAARVMINGRQQTFRLERAQDAR